MSERKSSSATKVPSFRALIAENSPGVTTIEIGARGVNSRIGLPSGPTKRAVTVAHGSSLTTIGSRPADLPEKRTVAPSLRFGFEERHGKLGIRVEPVQLELAVARDAVVIAGPRSKHRKSRVEVDPADHPDIRDRLAVGPDHLAFHRHAWAERYLCVIRVLALAARLRITGNERVGVHTRTARLTEKEQALSELLKHVIVAGRPHDNIAASRRDRHRRTIRRPWSLPAARARKDLVIGWRLRKEGTPPRLIQAGRSLPPRPLPRIITPRGNAKSTECVTSPFGPFNAGIFDQVRLPVGRKGGHGALDAQSRIRAELPVGIGRGDDRTSSHADLELVEPGDRHPGMRDRLAGIGVGHATGDGPDGLQGQAQRLRAGIGIRVDLDDLAGEPRVEDAQEHPQPRADAVEGEPPVGAGDRRAGPAG